MRHAEYPHTVTFQKLSRVSDGGGGWIQSWSDVLTISGFVDTPSSREIFTAQQLNNPLDRNLFFAYREDIEADMRCTCKGVSYELIGRPQDQGGQEEVMKVPLKLVQNGG